MVRAAAGRVDVGDDTTARAADPKSLSLCAQARHALAYALGGECGDEALQGLDVVEVMPDPTVRRLRVWLGCRAELDEDERLHVMARLAAARGFLRARVAQAIHRKRTPELAFELLVRTRGIEEEMT